MIFFSNYVKMIIPTYLLIMTDYTPINPNEIIEFLINYFSVINIHTNASEWSHTRDYFSSPSSMQRKFHHEKMGYFDVEEERSLLYFNLPVLETLRRVSAVGDLEIVKKLFSLLEEDGKNPNIGYLDDTEYNLTNACRFGQLEIIKFLVGKGVDIHVESEINIISAIQNKHYEIAKYLLDTDKRINQDVILKNSKPETISFINTYNLYHKLEKEVQLKNKTNKIKL